MKIDEQEEAKHGNQKSILIFDANIAAARQFARLFRSKNWEDIDIVSNQWILIDRLKSPKKYEFIFADLDCAVDDTEVLEALRELSKGARVVLLTSIHNERVHLMQGIETSTVITRRAGDSAQLTAVVDEIVACH